MKLSELKTVEQYISERGRTKAGFDKDHWTSWGVSIFHKTLFVDFFGFYMNVYLGKVEN